MHHYFAYGSNLDPVQMKRRCPDSSVHGVAILRGHRLVFPLPCDRWGGGVAGIEPVVVPAPDAAVAQAAGLPVTAGVEGVVYRVSDADLEALDGYENVAAGDYERRIVAVETANGPLEVWTYYAIPHPHGSPPPSRRYLDAILRGGRHHGLSDVYLDHVARTSVCDG